MADTITQGEWMDALAEAMKRQTGEGPDGFTTREAARAMGITRGSANARLRDLFDQGKLEKVGDRDMESMSGTIRPVPVYRLIQNGKLKKKGKK